MEKIKEYVNHPLTKCITVTIVGAVLLLESHPMYAGVAFGYALRELFLAFKAD
jgi:hypothetical protein